MEGQKISFDNHKLMYHPDRVAEWLKTGDCYPLHVEVGLTNICNHECIFCALDWVVGKDKNIIDTEVMLNNLEDMANHGVKSIVFAGDGEPLLHKDFSKIVEAGKSYNLDLAITTNGVLFNEEIAERCLPHLSWIRVSVNGCTKETYSKIHRTNERDFDKVISNIKNAADLVHKNNYSTLIGVQTLLLPENKDEIVGLAKLVKEIGADNIQIKPYSQHPYSENKIEIDYAEINLSDKLEALNNDKFQVVYRKNAIQRLKDRSAYNNCYGLSFLALISAKGDIMTCNLFYNNPEFIYGNLYKNSFSEIWQSERRKDIIKKINENGTHNCREVCRLDGVNRYLHNLKNPEAYKNFV